MSAAANAKLREQLGGTQTALRAKEAEFDALAQERDRLAKKLADQEESHKAALKAAQEARPPSKPNTRPRRRAGLRQGSH